MVKYIASKKKSQEKYFVCDICMTIEYLIKVKG